MWGISINNDKKYAFFLWSCYCTKEMGCIYSKICLLVVCAPGLYLGIGCNSDVGKMKAEREGTCCYLSWCFLNTKPKHAFNILQHPSFWSVLLLCEEDVALGFKVGIFFLFPYEPVSHGLSSLGMHSNVTDECWNYRDKRAARNEEHAAIRTKQKTSSLTRW